MVEKELKFIKIEDIDFCHKTSKEKVEEIAADFSWKKCGVLPIRLLNTKYELRDGNHRVMAAIKKGYKELPCILLTDEEVKFTRHTNNIILFTFKRPKRIITNKNGYIRNKKMTDFGMLYYWN